MFGIRCDRQQRLGHGMEEDAIDSSSVLKRQGGDLLRQRKHYVEVFLDRQQLGFSCGQPFGAGRRLTLWTTPVSTGVVRDSTMPTLIALLHMAAQSGGSACANILEGFSLLAGQYVPPPSQKVVSMCAEDIGHFQPMFTHRSG
jgi:hypothetical protein